MNRHQMAERALWARVGASPVERFFELPSGLRVRTQELGAGPTVLFVHGVMTAGTSFAPLVARLSQARCIVLDRPGCGGSAAWQLQPEFRAQAVQLLVELLDVMQIERAVVVGSSLGALWVTWFALAHPSRVKKLVLLGPSIGFPGVHIPMFMRIAGLPGLGTLIRKKLKISPVSLRRMFAEMGHQKSMDAGLIPHELFDWGVTLDATGTPRRDFESIQRAVGVTGPRRWIQLGDAALRELSVPALLVAGIDDTHGGPALAARAASSIRDARIETLANAGHLPWLDDPGAVAEAVQQFIAAEDRDVRAEERADR
jgi:2-hydroxy-6-oxonona-2,4-dienedioate hydrolase